MEIVICVLSRMVLMQQRLTGRANSVELEGTLGEAYPWGVVVCVDSYDKQGWYIF